MAPGPILEPDGGSGPPTPHPGERRREHDGTSDGAPRPTGPDPAGVARWIAARRGRLDLSEDDLAARAGMAPSCLRHLVQAGPDFDRAAFLRIAAGLGLSYAELLEGRSGPSPGQGGAPTHPVLVHLTDDECRDRIGAVGPDTGLSGPG
ncbi:hypothetical protein GCM10010495_67720 [Kitasatospora herbaricolor]|uniref:helix-turn-helix domain-containing protein n=1 Tax=Kitasatospora herbaricolor TaxID=68217 RepID=UPI00174DB723|nr:helix-turn-helix transcriptional regulator [Kitasatospora herbaricolor]MDQ0312427.1 transcriptional regulator with XRE-family HTH domain [Kitasatospora herbaricolor]GGV40677.1 hypothetical protein GCM10010495_67720 [Kitasatospora herbaricolor]